MTSYFPSTQRSPWQTLSKVAQHKAIPPSMQSHSDKNADISLAEHSDKRSGEYDNLAGETKTYLLAYALP